MTNGERDNLHALILQTLRTVGELGRPADRLTADLRMATCDITLPALEVELRALADKRWIAQMPQALGSARYRITAMGRSVLEEQGL